MEYFREREKVVPKIMIKRDTILRVLFFLAGMIVLLGLELLWAMFMGDV